MGCVNRITKVKVPRTPALILQILLQNVNEPIKKDLVCNLIWSNTDFFIRRNLDVQVYKIKKLLIDSEYELESIYNKLILKKYNENIEETN